MRPLLVALLASLVSFSLHARGSDPAPSLEVGAKVFAERCALCHGGNGMGEGMMPLMIKDYPKTSLIKENKTDSRHEIYEAVVYGGSREGISNYMPPMGDDLTWTELESVVDYVVLIRQNPEEAQRLKQGLGSVLKASRKVGRQIFESRCILCHGPDGEGDGRLSKIIKAPPPANLRLSRLPDEYTLDIIKRGGEGVGRSPKMPPWGDQFNQHEMNSLMLFVKSLRSE